MLGLLAHPGDLLADLSPEKSPIKNLMPTPRTRQHRDPLQLEVIQSPLRPVLGLLVAHVVEVKPNSITGGSN